MRWSDLRIYNLGIPGPGTPSQLGWVTTIPYGQGKPEVPETHAGAHSKPGQLPAHGLCLPCPCPWVSRTPGCRLIRQSVCSRVLQENLVHQEGISAGLLKPQAPTGPRFQEVGAARSTAAPCPICEDQHLDSLFSGLEQVETRSDEGHSTPCSHAWLTPTPTLRRGRLRLGVRDLSKAIQSATGLGLLPKISGFPWRGSRLLEGPPTTGNSP